jgi:hypothetical protein
VAYFPASHRYTLIAASDWSSLKGAKTMKNTATLIFTWTLRMGILLGLLAGLLRTPGTVSALSYKFASPSGTPANACTYTDPCDLQTAVDTSSPGGLVFVAAGTYHPYALPSDQVLLLTNNVHIYGGWDGISGPEPIPDPETNITILDGQDARRGVTAVFYSDSASLSGVTIHNGNATGKYAMCSGSSPAGCGGGIFIAGVSLVIENCIIADNIAATTTAVSERTGYGGGIYIQNPDGVTISNNLIHSNDASTATSGPIGDNGMGGGIYVTGATAVSDLTITGNEIHSNNAVSTMYSGLGDGLYIDGGNGSISKNFFHDNNPNLYDYGNALFAKYSDITISGNRFINNHGVRVLYLLDFSGNLISNIIDNPGVSYGVYLEINNGGRFSQLVNNIIAHHASTNIYISGYSGLATTANLYHNTLDGAPYGIYLYQYTTIIVTHCIISHHPAIGIYKAGTYNTVTVNYTLFHGNGLDGDWDTLIHPIPSGDPYYVDAAGGDYHIQSNSAARDQATSTGYTYDFESDVRPMGAGSTPYDVGADEFWWKLYLPVILKP